MRATLRRPGMGLFVTFALALTLAGCEKMVARKSVMMAERSGAGAPAEAEADKSVTGPVTQRPTLAITRSVNIETDVDGIAPRFASTRAACEAEAQAACVVLDSNLTTGEYPQATLRMRAAPAGIARVLARLRAANGVVSESTSAEDLAAPLVESERRLAMQRDYRDSLLALRAKGTNDINALIRVNQELAQVQSQLEAVNGERAHLQQKIDTETLTVNISTGDGSAGNAHPVARALRDFGHNLSQGVAGAITFVAYLIPWAVVILPLGWALRWLWRRRRSAR